MKLLSWNVNGLRSLKSDVKETLKALDADIVCFQETKASRCALEEDTAIIEGYNSYFSFPRCKSGYSGVATYCRDSCRPVCTEEGLSGLISSNEKIGKHGDYSEFDKKELLSLDSEGRALLTLHNMKCGERALKVVIVNVYCPRGDPEKPERIIFKLKFYRLLELRVKALVRDGYKVIILGDINTSHKKIDHCDPGADEEFNSNLGRQWLNNFLVDVGNTEDKDFTGKFVDTFRHFSPAVEKAFTCWCTQIGARQTNYGTRIDYIFCDSVFISHFVSSEVRQEIEGSDHCPVSASICCNPVPSCKIPLLCTRNWPEFSGHQTSLASFFQKDTMSDSLKRKIENEECLANLGKKPKAKAGQLTLNSFFGKKILKNSPGISDLSTDNTNIVFQEEDCSTEKKILNSCSDSCGFSSSVTTQDTKQSEGWKSILKGPPPPPLCKGHNESSILKTVKKSGPNKGRQFYVCARPEGDSNNRENKCDFFQWLKPSKSVTKK